MITVSELKKYIAYDYKTGKFKRLIFRKGGELCGGKVYNQGFIVFSVRGRQYLAHKLAWLYYYGESPEYKLNHVNGNKLDNRICNLEEMKKGRGIAGQKELKEWLKYCEVTGNFTWIKSKQYSLSAGDIAGTLQPHGYLGIRFNGKDYRLHRLAWLYTYGVMPKNIDHINHNRSDNRMCNLREAECIDNSHNLSLKPNNKSGFNGVCWDKFRNKWSVEIRINNKKIYLGRFINKQDAIEARKAANIKYGFHENHGKKSIAA